MTRDQAFEAIRAAVAAAGGRISHADLVEKLEDGKTYKAIPHIPAAVTAKVIAVTVKATGATTPAAVFYSLPEAKKEA
jgi:hypothetical protein